METTIRPKSDLAVKRLVNRAHRLIAEDRAEPSRMFLRGSTIAAVRQVAHLGEARLTAVYGDLGESLDKTLFEHCWETWYPR